jgi:hypothetical protein
MKCLLSKCYYKKPLLTFAVVFMAITLAIGCDDSITFYDLGVSWTMDNPNPGSNTVFLAAVTSEPDQLVLAVDLNEITNGMTHGAYFDLTFRQEVLYFDGFNEGSVLETAGPVVYQAALDPQDSGRLIVGVSLLEDASVENANGVLIQIRFKALRSGTSSVVFENARLMTAEKGGTVPITGVSWYGGFATVVE